MFVAVPGRVCSSQLNPARVCFCLLIQSKYKLHVRRLRFAKCLRVCISGSQEKLALRNFVLCCLHSLIRTVKAANTMFSFAVCAMFAPLDFRVTRKALRCVVLLTFLESADKV